MIRMVSLFFFGFMVFFQQIVLQIDLYHRLEKWRKVIERDFREKKKQLEKFWNQP